MTLMSGSMGQLEGQGVSLTLLLGHLVQGLELWGVWSRVNLLLVPGVTCQVTCISSSASLLSRGVQLWVGQEGGRGMLMVCLGR